MSLCLRRGVGAIQASGCMLSDASIALQSDESFHLGEFVVQFNGAVGGEVLGPLGEGVAFACNLILVVHAVPPVGELRKDFGRVYAECVDDLRRILLNQHYLPVAELSAGVLMKDVPCRLLEFCVTFGHAFVRPDVEQPSKLSLALHHLFVWHDY